MIPCVRESEAEMRGPEDPYLWQSDDDSAGGPNVTAFARTDCPTADDALWAKVQLSEWDGWMEDTALRVRLAWCAEVHRGVWWLVSPYAPGAVECWLVSA